MPEFDGQEHQAAPSHRVKVITDDFSNALAGNRYNCALVWAIRRQFPDALRVHVDTEHVSWSEDEIRFVYPTTELIKEKIIKPLDTGGICEPVTVQLSNGYTKPVVHNDSEEAHRRLSRERKRIIQRARGEIHPSSSAYRRMTVVNAGE